MSKRKTECAATGAHFEVEKGYRLRKAEYKVLKQLLPTIGFAFQKESHITDFVMPSEGETTRRMRIENVKVAVDGNTGVTCIKGFKSHPIKGRKGRNVRFEDEKIVSPQRALSFILDMMNRLKAPIPYYNKTRWHYQGEFNGIVVTITLDHARGLDHYSGHYIEIETLLALGSEEEVVQQALATIEKLAAQLLANRRAKISYRKMLMKTWSKCRVTKKKKLQKVPRQKLNTARVNYKKLLKRVAKPVRKPA
ncbi:MAG: hypothetical protein SGJ27_09560 [Candidatus Melainabacteria bacterium]|nr:hypothetical protein [Candidatus Melainabacteria bacterium]